MTFALQGQHSVRHSATQWKTSLCLEYTPWQSELTHGLCALLSRPWHTQPNVTVNCAPIWIIKRREQEEEGRMSAENWYWSAEQRRVRRARPPTPCSCVVPLSDLTLITIRKLRVAFAGTQQYVAWWVVQADAGKHTLWRPERDVTQLEDLALFSLGVCFPDKFF